jgi:hypothetical protein
LGSKTSTALQTTLAAEAHLAEGQFLLEEQTLNKGNNNNNNIIIIIIIVCIRSDVLYYHPHRYA